MEQHAIDPWQLQWRLEAGNRIERWRAARAQTAFNAVALAALLALLALLGLRALLSSAAMLAAVLEAREAWIAPVLGLVLAWRQAGALAQQRGRMQASWLASQPVPGAILRRRLWRAALRMAGIDAVVIALLLAPLPVAAPVWLAAAAAVVLGAALGIPLARRVSFTRQAPVWFGTRRSDAGIGRLWRWQWIESGAALRGRRLALALWAWLLVPMGSGPHAVLALALCGVMVAMLGTAWQRSLSVLPQAQRWLDPQPLDGAALLRGTAALPLLLLAVALLLLATTLAVLGPASLALLSVPALLLPASLHYACVAATRRTPSRATWLLVLHLVLLLAVAQSALPLVVPMWLAQLAWLLRRALRA